MKKDVEAFLNDVYAWLCQPRNRCVEDYHYALLNMCKAKSVEGAVRSKRLRDEISAFLNQRYLQMEWYRGGFIDERGMSMATTIYIRNLCE